MKKFWIDYSTSIDIYAENEEDALKRLMEIMKNLVVLRFKLMELKRRKTDGNEIL